MSPLWIVPQYDLKFGDAFWNSSKYNMVSYLLRMMTSWALVCDVWYLPPMHQQVGLTTIKPSTFNCSSTHVFVLTQNICSA